MFQLLQGIIWGKNKIPAVFCEVLAFLNNKFNARGNAMIFYRYMVSSYFGNVAMGIRYRLNLNYLLPKDFIVEMFGNYNSSAKNIQGRNFRSITYSMAARKQF